MDDSVIKALTDLVGSLGLPAVLVIFSMVCWWKAQPRVLDFLAKVGSAMETLAVKQTQIADTVDEIRQDVRDLKRVPT